MRFPTKLTDSLLIAGISIAGSATTFVYEAGKLAFYDIPSTYVQLDLTRILTAAAAVGLIGTFVVLLVITSLAPSLHKHPVGEVLGKGLFVMALFSPFLVFAHAPWYAWLALFSGAVAYSFLPLLLLISRTDPRPFWDRVVEFNRSSVRDSSKPLPLLQTYIALPITGLLFLAALVSSIGRYMAAEETAFWVLEENPRMIVVTNYGDTLLLKEVDRDSNRMTDVIEVRKLQDDAPTRMRYVQLGKLLPSISKKP
jgi:hypothetical protein